MGPLRMLSRLPLATCIALLACDSDPAAPDVVMGSLRVVNGYSGSIAVGLDGGAPVATIAPGAIDTIPVQEGGHTVSMRNTIGSAFVSFRVTITGAMPSFAAIQSGGTLSSVALDDTNAVVPVGATKVRVLHLAPNAGEITVMRTQPDFATPIQWQFPFTYSSNITAVGNPFYQSTVGTWDIRAWRKPAEESLGWAGTQARIAFVLASGERRTVVVLDKEGGGIKLVAMD